MNSLSPSQIHGYFPSQVGSRMEWSSLEHSSHFYIWSRRRSWCLSISQAWLYFIQQIPMNLWVRGPNMHTFVVHFLAFCGLFLLLEKKTTLPLSSNFSEPKMIQFSVALKAGKLSSICNGGYLLQHRPHIPRWVPPLPYTLICIYFCCDLFSLLCIVFKFLWT